MMDRLKSRARFMIVSDLDHTMVDHHDSDNISLLRFNALWEANYRHDSLLVFSTGRSPTLYKQLRKQKPMITPDITIMSVGTEITYGKPMLPDDGWVQLLNHKWDRSIVIQEATNFPQLTPQAETEQRPHKVSFYVKKDEAQQVMEALSTSLKKHGLEVKIIYSGGIDLDILPKSAGKGQALAYLLKKFESEGKRPINTLVCGDSGNDAELFSIPGVYGVMVSNAQEELLQWHAQNAKDNASILHASERCAAGIIQAIGHFNIGPNLSPRDVSDIAEDVENALPGHEVVKISLLIEKWRRAEVENSELFLSSLKAVCHPSGVFIHPSGAEHHVKEYINVLRNYYGDKQGKQFRVWVDSILATQIGSDTWLVKFDKWESSGGYSSSSLIMSLPWSLIVFVHFISPFSYVSQNKQLYVLLTIWEPLRNNLSTGNCGRAFVRQVENFASHILPSPSTNSPNFVGEERQGCVVTAILSTKDSEWFNWVHVHQTWLEQSGKEEWLI